MLIGFSVGNYRSFKDEVSLSLVAAKLKSRDRQVDTDNTFEALRDVRLVRSVAIYGANASGKSNLVSALCFMRRFVLDSSKSTQAEEPIALESYLLSTETMNAPTYFEILFVLGEVRYRYGFEASQQRVVSEWLFSQRTSRESRLFMRRLDTVDLSEALTQANGLQERTRPNALFLSVAAQFNVDIAKNVLHWFHRLSVVSGLQDVSMRRYTVDSLLDGSISDDVIGLVRGLDLGISDIQVEKIDPLLGQSIPGTNEYLSRMGVRSSPPKDPRIVRTIHQVYDADERPSAVAEFNMETSESEGTKKLFSMAGPLVDALKTGRTLIVDELDARLHPLITSAIVRLFNSQESNPHNAQIVFTTQDTNLLSNTMLRRDQIWFVEKDRLGASHLYSLAEYKVRNDEAYELNYVRGKYGAIPFLGDLNQLLGGSDAEASCE